MRKMYQNLSILQPEYEIKCSEFTYLRTTIPNKNVYKDLNIWERLKGMFKNLSI